MARGYATLTREELETILRAGRPSNDDAEEGFALVSVMARDRFETGHIPGSIHVPRRDLRDLERRFDKGKKIVVYSASRRCKDSSKAAAQLTERGFRYVFDYAAGLHAWRRAGNAVETRAEAGGSSRTETGR